VKKRILTSVHELIIMFLAGQTEAGSVEVQPARDSQFKATNCRWGGSNNLPSHFTSFTDNLELCNALKNLIKKVPPKAVSLLAKGKKSLKTKSGFVQFTLNQYTRASTHEI
jgi:hypothetical protein